MKDPGVSDSVPALCDILADKTLQLLKMIEQKKTKGDHYITLKKEVQTLQAEIKKQKFDRVRIS